jgi:protein-S-isoprenylcysteine O-methyltransferase Ste14
MAPYLYLIALWALFGLLHSLLAANWWKEWVQRKTGAYFRYYRLSYSLLSLLLLIVIVVYHRQIPLFRLWHTPLLLQLLSALLAAVGLVILVICVRKYFFYLSGAAVFFQRQEPPAKLETGGLHRYVRHPLYVGTLLLVWGMLPLLPQLSYLISCIMITVYTCIGAVFEERKLVKEFGEAYRHYQRSVPMWGIRPLHQ